MYRSERNEEHFTPAQKLAWDFVLPYRYIPILESDTRDAENLAVFLDKHFSKQALRTAAKKEST